jgi:hypothetical protein
MRRKLGHAPRSKIDNVLRTPPRLKHPQGRPNLALHGCARFALELRRGFGRLNTYGSLDNSAAAEPVLVTYVINIGTLGTKPTNKRPAKGALQRCVAGQSTDRHCLAPGMGLSYAHELPADDAKALSELSLKFLARQAARQRTAARITCRTVLRNGASTGFVVPPLKYSHTSTLLRVHCSSDAYLKGAHH